MLKYINEAYKPEEHLVFIYMLIKTSLESILTEQKFPKDVELELFKIYQNFKSNSSGLLNRYTKLKAVLPLHKLLEDLREEKDAVLAGAEISQPFLDEKEACFALAKFIIEVELEYLEEARELQNAIPEFHWDVDSFIEAFSALQERCEKYANE